MSQAPQIIIKKNLKRPSGFFGFFLSLDADLDWIDELHRRWPTPPSQRINR